MDYSLQKSSDDHTVSTTIIDIVSFLLVLLLIIVKFFTQISHLPICSPFDEDNLLFGVIKLSKVYNCRSSYDSFDHIVVNE